MYLEHSRSQQAVYKDSLLSHSDSFSVATQARQEIQIWLGLTQRHMGVRGRTVT
jgi:hypothetical protein